METMRRTFFVAFYLEVYLVQRTMCLNCTESGCPTHIPYCTPVGCVFACPNGTYTDGRFCKIDCGEKYILDTECIDVCPKSESFVNIQVITLGQKFVRLRFCMATCPAGTYGFNNQCLRSCPGGYKFVEKGICQSSCSENKYRLNVTIDGHLTAMKCLVSCDLDSHPLVQDGFCVSVCKPGSVIYNGTCRQDCPEDNEMRDTVKDGVIYCKSKCDDKERQYVQNNQCVKKCSNGFVLVKGTCQPSCPNDMPLKYADDIGNVFCLDKCDIYSRAYLVEEGYCVPHCKKGHVVYRNSCHEQCPVNVSIHVLDKDERGLYHTYCRINCDSVGAYTYNNTCVNRCPNGSKFIFNKICLDKCPKTAPYFCGRKDQGRCETEISGVNEDNFLCMNRCPIMLMEHGYKCTPNCPQNTYVLGHMCLESCNGSTPYINGSTCVSRCPAGTNLKDGTCITTGCTTEFPYKINHGDDTIFVAKCNETEVLDGNKCIKRSDCTKPIVFQGKCRNDCPIGYIYSASRNSDVCIQKATLIGSAVFLVFLLIGIVFIMVVFLSTKQIYTSTKPKSDASAPSQRASIEDVDESGVHEEDQRLIVV